MNFLLPLLYTALFSWLILKLNFFRQSNINPWLRLSLFWLKILTGILVVYVYTHFYKNADTADILLYYNDGKIIYNSIFTNPGDFIRMLTGINYDNEYFYSHYFSHMQRWSRIHDSLFVNDCRTIIRFNAFCDLFAFGSFHVNTVFMCFISYSGLIALYRAFLRYFAEKKRLLLFAIFLCPSLLFWSSGVLKEGIFTFAAGFFVYAAMAVWLNKKYSAVNFLILAVAGFFLIANKLYVFLALLAPLLAFLLYERFRFRLVLPGFILLTIVSSIAGTFILNKVFKKDVVQELIHHQRDFINIARGGIYLNRDTVIIRMEYDQEKQLIPTAQKDCVLIRSGSSYEYWLNEKLYDTLRQVNSPQNPVKYFIINKIEPARSAYYMPHLKPEISSFASYAPRAFINVLMRPWLSESAGIYQKIVSLENLFYLLVIIFCIVLGDYKNVNRPLFWLGIFFTVQLFLIIGFTTPVAGALVRYKVPILPFLLMSAFNLLSVQKLKRIPLLKRLAGG